MNTRNHVFGIDFLMNFTGIQARGLIIGILWDVNMPWLYSSGRTDKDDDKANQRERDEMIFIDQHYSMNKKADHSRRLPRMTIFKFWQQCYFMD